MIILNAYYNDLIIPESLPHSSGKVGMKILIALAEVAVLISIIYASNRGVLSDTDDNKTAKVQLIITVCFIVAVILS